MVSKDRLFEIEPFTMNIKIPVCEVHIDNWELSVERRKGKGMYECAVCGQWTNNIIFFSDRRSIPSVMWKYLD